MCGRLPDVIKAVDSRYLFYEVYLFAQIIAVGGNFHLKGMAIPCALEVEALENIFHFADAQLGA